MSYYSVSASKSHACESVTVRGLWVIKSCNIIRIYIYSLREGQQVNTSTRNSLYLAIISLHLPFRINNPAHVCTLKLLSYNVYGAKECEPDKRLHFRRSQDARLSTVKLSKTSQLMLFKETIHVCSDNYMNKLHLSSGLRLTEKLRNTYTPAYVAYIPYD